MYVIIARRHKRPRTANRTRVGGRDGEVMLAGGEGEGGVETPQYRIEVRTATTG
jgi:hypothetical protein